jgi:hypothetical protein
LRPVHFEGVAFDQFDFGPALANVRGEFCIELNGGDAVRVFEQNFGERAAAWADFYSEGRVCATRGCSYTFEGLA